VSISSADADGPDHVNDSENSDDLALRQLFADGFVRETVESAVRSHAALRAGSEGTPVVFVPGFTGSKEDFVRVLGPASVAGYTAVAIDQRGQFETAGRGAAELESQANYTMEALAQELLQVIEALGGRAHVVGHSFGGLVARAAAIVSSQSFASLVLMDSGPYGLTGAPRQRLEYMRSILQAGGIEAVYRAIQALAIVEPGYEPAPEALEQFLHRRFVSSSPTMLLGMGQALLEESDRTDELRDSGVRLLVLHGADEDVWLGDSQNDMARRLGAPLVVIDKAAHSPALDNPAATSQALHRFWSSD